MTCQVCQHCQESVTRTDGYAVLGGCSYHMKCHKCYMCSETNLHNAEVFKGVIFCSSCSQRIFQGCSTARKTKCGDKDRRGRRSRSKSKSRKRARSPAKGRHRSKSPGPIPAGVIELAHLAAAASRSSGQLPDVADDNSKQLEVTTELALQVGKRIHDAPLMENDNWNIKKDRSVEIGVTTDVTQELLRQMKCPVVEDKEIRSSVPRRKPKSRRYVKDVRLISNRQNSKCSDWRIAELGASTEIANMALKKKSEVPIIIRSINGLKQTMESPQPSSCLNQESDVSGDSNVEWTNHSYGSERGSQALKEVRIVSLLRRPIRCFKKNILQRSSLIDLMICNEDDKSLVFQKLKTFFHEEVTEHQRRGVQRLYSTIIRRKIPYRMGWPHLIGKESGVFRLKHPRYKGTCKHFRRSHSFRCMRAQVMKVAGPTKSELALFRLKLKKIILPSCFRHNFKFSNKYAEIMSRACGSEPVN